ncbi:Protein of unknown function [Bacillus mycoides]|nr:Protein of unknown function [Bacillus mycoides]
MSVNGPPLSAEPYIYETLNSQVYKGDLDYFIFGSGAKT